MRSKANFRHCNTILMVISTAAHWPDVLFGTIHDLEQLLGPFTVYDEVGRVAFVRHPDATLDSWEYSGLTTTHTNTEGQTSTIIKNPMGETISQTRAPDGGTTTFEDEPVSRHRHACQGLPS